jgi:hypothetical protein
MLRGTLTVEKTASLGFLELTDDAVCFVYSGFLTSCRLPVIITV